MKNIIVFSVGFFSLLFFPSSTYAYSSNISATVVLGQTAFNQNSANRGGSAADNTLNGPRGVAVCNGKVVVSDFSNNRVLVWNSIPTTNGASANVVIGQTSMSGTTANAGGISSATLNGPFDVECTPDDKLLIADTGNHRVLIFNTIPTTNGASANIILGQPNGSSSSINQGVSNLGLYQSCINQSARAYTMRRPEGIATNGTRLVVLDSSNQRGLIWNSFPTVTNQSADLVVGQPTLDTVGFQNSCSQYMECGQNSLGGEPIGVAIAGEKLIISNTFANGGHSVRIWNSWPTSNGQYPDIVIGQSNFTSCNANQGLSSPTAQTLNNPFGVHVDYLGRLFISDRTNARLLMFNRIPTSNNQAADIVIGQQTFTTSSVNQGNSTSLANTLSGSRMVSTYQSQLFVSDGDNNRVLIFDDDIINIPLSIPGSPQPRPASCNSPAPTGEPDLFQIDTSFNSAILHFSPTSKPYTNYYIAYGKSPNAEEHGVTFETDFSSGAITYPIYMLNSYTTYYFKVRAGNGCMPGSWSSILEATTNYNSSYKYR